MNCRQVQDELLVNFGAELPDTIKEHLESCPECRALRDELAGLREHLPDDTSFQPDQLAVASLSAGVESRLDKLDLPAKTTSIRHPWYRYVSIAASILLVFGASIIMYTSHLSLSSSGVTAVDTVTIVTTSTESTIDAELVEPTDAMFQTLLDDYVQDSRLSASEMLLDDLTDEEYEYLQNNFDVGDLL